MWTDTARLGGIWWHFYYRDSTGWERLSCQGTFGLWIWPLRMLGLATVMVEDDVWVDLDVLGFSVKRRMMLFRGVC